MKDFKVSGEVSIPQKKTSSTVTVQDMKFFFFISFLIVQSGSLTTQPVNVRPVVPLVQILVSAVSTGRRAAAPPGHADPRGEREEGRRRYRVHALRSQSTLNNSATCDISLSLE
jgi:hypothetical protein